MGSDCLWVWVDKNVKLSDTAGYGGTYLITQEIEAGGLL